MAGNKTGKWAHRTVGFSTTPTGSKPYAYRLHSRYARRAARLDAFQTPEIAVTTLVEREGFYDNVWEPANGLGDITKALGLYGFDVYTSDIWRWHSSTQTRRSFLEFTRMPPGVKDIITNPPFKLANKFVLHGLKLLPKGGKIALLLRTQYMEGGYRYTHIYSKTPPIRIYQYSFRLPRMRRFGFKGKQPSSVLSFAWFVWEKGFQGDTTVHWIGKER
jgi:hypothetical protein